MGILLHTAIMKSLELTKPERSFQRALRTLLLNRIHSLRSEGTVGMSGNNLWQIMASDVSRLPQAPDNPVRARQIFDALIHNSKFTSI